LLRHALDAPARCTDAPLPPPQNNLTRTPKGTAYWFAKHFYADSARHDPSYYKGMFALNSSGPHASAAGGRVPASLTAAALGLAALLFAAAMA
jgi:hypothetical protein